MEQLLIPFIAAVVTGVVVLIVGIDFRLLIPGSLFLVIATLAFGIVHVLVVYHMTGDIEAASDISDASVETAIESLPNLVIGEIIGGFAGAAVRPIAWAIGVRI